MPRRRKVRVTQYQLDALQFLKPPEQLTVSEWAEQYRMLDNKSSAMPGPWSNDMTPYLVGVMDELNNYETEKIIFVKPTQIGGTEALHNMIGYIVAQDPSPTMIVYPTETLAKSVSENRLQPMLMATPELREKYDENSSLLELQFDGMYLTLAGSNSPSGLASKPIRFLLMDEIDKYPGASSREADPIKLATERTKTFHNKKIYMTSTPTIKTGHIWKEKENADIEKHFFVVIALNHDIIGLAHVEVYARSDATQVGGNGKFMVAIFNEEAHIVGAIVRHFKCCDFEVANLKRYLFIEWTMVVFEAA